MEFDWLTTEAPADTLFLVEFPCVDPGRPGRALWRVRDAERLECLVNAAGPDDLVLVKDTIGWADGLRVLSTDQDKLWALYVQCQLGGSIYVFEA